eukprot:GFKZ01010227.1.p1 GENE.GFKZ01010227.1~~GFKZ01010227.1.p1  ORF type:complete len:523 (+),score=45.30 GFKZ01010227.1:35-1570(+)
MSYLTSLSVIRPYPGEDIEMSLTALRKSRLVHSFAGPPFASLRSPSSPKSAYIHLPFCAQQCAYCAFPVIVSGRSALPIPETQKHPPPSEAHRDYVDLVCREIRAVARRWKSRLSSTDINPLSTLYLGGGTPSLLHPSLLQQVIDTISHTFGLRSDAEISCEMDPATFTFHTAEAYRELGVNRASVGAQSFDDDLLSTCRRVHRSSDINAAVATLRRTGFANISLDLISGLPGQTLLSWKDSLQAALQLYPEHISCYDLTLEPGTAFGDKYESGIGPLPPEDIAAEMMIIAADVLKGVGFEHYEVSNFAKLQGHQQSIANPNELVSHTSPFRSRHNMTYWRNEPFYAFGLGATSLLDGYRFARPRRLQDYQRYVDDVDSFLNSKAQADSLNAQQLQKQTNERFYPAVKPLTPTESLEDYLINSFRLLVEGVDLEKVEEFFGASARQRLETAVDGNCYHVEQGNIHVTRSKHGRLRSVRLTEQGALIENSILSSLLQEAVWKHQSSRNVPVP